MEDIIEVNTGEVKTARPDVETGTVMYSKGDSKEKLLRQPSGATAIESEGLKEKKNG